MDYWFKFFYCGASGTGNTTGGIQLTMSTVTIQAKYTSSVIATYYITLKSSDTKAFKLV
jgi:hypothetical protein